MSAPAPIGNKSNSPRFFLLLLFAAALGVGAWFLCRPSKLPALPQVSRSELTLRNGHLYLGQGPLPFTGFLVEFYQTNLLQSRSLISNGLLNGLSEGWHTNGQLQIQESFKDGVSHGLRTKWYPDGTRMTEGLIVEGKHNGLFRRWHENGSLAEEIQMRNGVPEGPSRSFYPSGFLKAQALMTNGQATDQKFWQDGQQPGSPSKN